MSALCAGYGEVTITPPLGTDLTGYGFYLDRRAESVLDDLKVRGLYLEDGATRLLLLSCDLIGFHISRADRIRARISAELGLPCRNILLACTHTHSGPATAALPGLGRVNFDYVRRLPAAILDAAERAVRSAAAAEVGWGAEALEPIGFNRRFRNFEEIDPWLQVLVVRRKKSRIFLLNYPCHPVTLGPTREVSADWPGAAVREIERGGDRGLFVQGFCGDIDPVAYLNRRTGATAEDLHLYGTMLAARARKAAKRATFLSHVQLRAEEKRIRLPLLVPRRKDLERDFRAALRSGREFPKAARFLRRWRQRAEKHQAALRRSPWLQNVPLQAIAIGEMRLLGLPGEVFCGYGLKLRKRFPALMTAGLANGDIGYLPTRRAFISSADYACYFAPKFYSLFPFSPAVEPTLLGASRESLRLF
jgi:hypothetical protein